MKNKIMILGHGFLGKAFEKKGFKVLGKDELILRRGQFIPSPSQDMMEEYNIIINCIGKSNTRWCEKDENWDDALFVNGEIPKMLSKYCYYHNKKFVQISTGCLYDENDVEQKEDDFISAHCNYVITKWVGEKGCNPKEDLILRPRLYFGDFEDKNNLLCKLPGFPNFVTELNSYTSVHVIVDAVEALLEAKQSGIFNVACDGILTVKGLAELVELEGEEISEKELHKREGLYLVNSTMDISKLKKFYKPPQLEEEIKRCWKELEK